MLFEYTEIKTLEDEVFLVTIKLQADKKQLPPVYKISWSEQAADIHALWHPGADRNKTFQADWAEGFQSKNTSLAPVVSLYNMAGRNRLTFAFSDALNNLSIQAGMHEEDSTFLCTITLFEEPMPEIDYYEAKLRIDRRNIAYYEALGGVSRWWETFPGFEPSSVPDIALQPMYSTWYSYHQELTATELEEQSKLAKEIGCESIIVDDGWQTDDNNRGYAYTGDWEVYTGKIPDMRKHVDAVHATGLKYMLWYSVPFIGKKSRIWDRFSGKLLGVIDGLDAGVLDPRYPEVREYLIGIYERAVSEWDIDGLKLDFVDSFKLFPGHDGEAPENRDYNSVPEAVDRLLTDVMLRVRKIKPDILIEFRQTYIGPLMRKYGNMFRANDCPNDSIQNRIRTLDLRLLSGNTAVHSDMIMFNYKEPVESAAMQLVNVIFSVPQISVRLEEIGEPYLEMIRFWLEFCKEHGETLLKGELTPTQPELLFPLVRAKSSGKEIIALYANLVAVIEEAADQLIVVNGTYNEATVVKCNRTLGRYELTVKDCCGRIVESRAMELEEGLHEIAIPKAGAAFFTKLSV